VPGRVDRGDRAGPSNVRLEATAQPRTANSQDRDGRAGRSPATTGRRSFARGRVNRVRGQGLLVREGAKSDEDGGLFAAEHRHHVAAIGAHLSFELEQPRGHVPLHVDLGDHGR